MPLLLLLKITPRSMSFSLWGSFSLCFMDEISGQGDSFLFFDLDVDDDSEEDEDVEKFLIFTSEFFSWNHCWWRFEQRWVYRIFFINQQLLRYQIQIITIRLWTMLFTYFCIQCRQLKFGFWRVEPMYLIDTDRQLRVQISLFWFDSWGFLAWSLDLGLSIFQERQGQKFSMGWDCLGLWTWPGPELDNKDKDWGALA